VALAFAHLCVVPLFAQGNRNKEPDRALKVSKQTDSKSPTASNDDATRKPQLVVQLGHSRGINAVAFSKDGRFILTGASDQLVVIWDATTGGEIRRFAGHSEQVTAVAFSPDAKFILSGSTDETARLWDVEAGNEIRRFAAEPSTILSVAFSPDGQFVLTGSTDNLARLWNAQTGEVIRRYVGHSGSVVAVKFSHDGRHILTGSNDQTARLWNTSTGIEERRFVGHADPLNAVAFSPDDRFVLTGSGNLGDLGRGDKTARLWDAATGQEIQRFVGHTDPVMSVASSPDGKFVLTGAGDEVAFGNDRTARLWEISSGREVQRFVGHLSNVPGVEFSPDGLYVLTGSWDHSACLWDIATGMEKQRFTGYSHNVSSAVFSPDGRYILTGGSDRDGKANSAHLWDTLTGQEVRRFTGHSGRVAAVVFSPDGNLVLTGSSDKSARLWKVATGEEILRFLGHSDYVTSVAFSPDGRFVSTGSGDKTVRLWDVVTGQEVRRFVGHSYGIRSVAFSPDGRLLLTGSDDQSARVWDLATSRNVQVVRHADQALSRVNSATYSPDGKLILTGSVDRTARLWSAETGKEFRQFQGHSGFVNSVAFSPDGRILLTGADDNTARLWDAITGETIKVFKGHSGGISSVAFSPDGRLALTASQDSTVGVWDVLSGQERCRFLSSPDGAWVVFNRDGYFDTNKLEEIRGLHWIMPDDPMSRLPLEIFMRDYYEPRLLPRILNGETFKPLRKLSELNRIQPDVRVTSIERRKDKPDLLTVTVEVGKATGGFKAAGGTIKRETGIYDLRLFRDGQIVGQIPDEAAASMLTRPKIVKEQALVAWRQANQIRLDATGKRLVKFENIKLPRKADAKQVEFSAYAFNEDRVKSRTDRKRFDIPTDLTRKKGKAYVITVGVNAYENPAFDLKYSVNDAKLIESTITDRLQKVGEYEQVVTVPLISDYKREGGNRTVTQATATKKHVKAVLNLLAGRPIDAELKKQIPNADKLQQVSPEDFVLISFSSHGYADSDGNFYFVLYDTGPGTGEEITEALLRKLSVAFLSSEELSLWLRDMDAGEMLMIVDACHSAAAVQGKEFKPGPMGSRGLGQLSYDKGMRVLTATQGADVAYGIGALKHGLLTYALVKDGIEAGKADFKPVDKRIMVSEWLLYGEQGVPRLLEEVSRKSKGRDAPAELKDLVQKTSADIRTQRPSLFDFSRKRDEVLLVKP
jgi:WD40 repeat protein/uncharacterized caspase-like protein